MRVHENMLLEGTMNRFNHVLFAAAPWNRIVLLVLLCPFAVAAQDGPLSLEDAVDKALQEAPQVTASAATLEAAGAVAPSAGRLPDPELVTGVDNLPINSAERYSLTRDFMTMRKIGVMQSFPNGEKRRLQGERAQREIAVAQGELLKTRFDTSRAVAEAWIARQRFRRRGTGGPVAGGGTGRADLGARTGGGDAARGAGALDQHGCGAATCGYSNGSRSGSFAGIACRDRAAASAVGPRTGKDRGGADGRGTRTCAETLRLECGAELCTARTG